MTTHLSLKILVIGDENVGKTTIVNYFTLVPIKNTSTVGIDFQSRIVALSADEKRLDLDKSEKGDKSDISIISNISNISDHESETLLLSTMKVDVDVKSTLSKPAFYDYVKCYFWDTSGHRIISRSPTLTIATSQRSWSFLTCRTSSHMTILIPTFAASFKKMFVITITQSLFLEISWINDPIN